MTYEARIIEGSDTFAYDAVRMVVRRDGRQYLMADGTWMTYGDGEVIPPTTGVLIPRGAVEAVAQAIAEWQGHTSHADTEARVLREWLAAERERVDRLIGESRP